MGRPDVGDVEVVIDQLSIEVFFMCVRRVDIAGVLREDRLCAIMANSANQNQDGSSADARK